MGTLHWMQEGLGYPDNHEQHDDTVIILLDPDQILVRPFTNDFTNSSEVWRLKSGQNKLKVEHGSPFSQQYGYGIQWKRKVDFEHVFQGPSPITTMAENEAWNYYTAMGPPYIATAKDMYTIVSTWAEIVPRVHDNYPHLLAGTITGPCARVFPLCSWFSLRMVRILHITCLYRNGTYRVYLGRPIDCRMVYLAACLGLFADPRCSIFTIVCVQPRRCSPWPAAHHCAFLYGFRCVGRW